MIKKVVRYIGFYSTVASLCLVHVMCMARKEVPTEISPGLTNLKRLERTRQLPPSFARYAQRSPRKAAKIMTTLGWSGYKKRSSITTYKAKPSMKPQPVKTSKSGKVRAKGVGPTQRRTKSARTTRM